MTVKNFKRFYDKVGFGAAGNGYQLELDGRPVLTPDRNTLVVPYRALGEAIAEEWRLQGEEVDFDSMPCTRLSYGVLDKGEAAREEMLSEVCSYCRSDLLCYRADGPDSLIALQSEKWQPVLDWAAEEHGIVLEITSGVVAVGQPENSIEQLYSLLGSKDLFELHGIATATALLGSTVLALALCYGRVSADEAVELSLLDELWQASKWGSDAEAEEARARRRVDVQGVSRFFAALHKE